MATQTPEKTVETARTQVTPETTQVTYSAQLHTNPRIRTSYYLLSSCPTVCPCLDCGAEGVLGRTICATAVAAAAPLLLLLLLPFSAVVLFCCSCRGCSRSPPHEVGRPGISSYVFLPRAPPGSPFPSVVPGSASGVHGMILWLLLPVLCRYSGAAAMYVLVLCRSGDALVT